MTQIPADELWEQATKHHNIKIIHIQASPMVLNEIKPKAPLHPCIPIVRYRLKTNPKALNIHHDFERRKPLSRVQLWLIRTILKWEISEL